MKKIFLSLLTAALISLSTQGQNTPLPDTGISGVYEVMVGTDRPQYHIRYFREFGFRVVDSASLTAAQAKAIYGVDSPLKSYRLQNGEVDSHGLLRLLAWEKPLGPGVGYAVPETIGQRMAVMMTKDIMRLVDIYKLERENGEKWLPIEPIFDDLYNLSSGKPSFFNRPIGVRETAIYGEWFVHVFFQRYGYTIPGYGTINPEAPLQTSEFTHHDFIIKGDMETVTRYYSQALGLQPEEPAPVIDGDWQKGPRRVFDMPPGYSHYYRGFVSPNNICGKLKFFVPRAPKPDHSQHQRIGELGITLHSLWTPKLRMVYDLLKKQGIQPSAIQQNEFGENSFIFTGPDGVSWQIIEKTSTKFKPVTKREFILTGQ
ncbi:MAG: hypothetical protein RMJ44_02900 [Cytophagales bacterium]|nr:hypothetical protein [Bernardetiaceae bacterium]MDW8210011.1 hypothetical protein [Cytophagales bacterium]